MDNASGKTAIIALGKNWELPIPSEPEALKLSIESQMTVRAALLLYEAGKGEIIIFSTGKTAGSHHTSEAAAMASYLQALKPEAHAIHDAVVLEETSYDTRGNIRAIQQLTKTNHIGSIILITIGYHVPRVRYLIRKVGLQATVLSSDTVLQTYGRELSHPYARIVWRRTIKERTLKHLGRTTASYALEAAGWMGAILDPYGSGLSNTATARLRKQ